MRYEVTTLHTKKAFADALKNEIETKPFSKITVSDIVRDCGVNRKTFYYHFEDIYDLLKWTLQQEAIEVMKQFDLLVEYEEAIRFVMDYVEENKVFLRNVYHSLGREELKRFFYFDFKKIVESIVNEGKGVMNVKIPESFETFIVEFYTEALAGILLEWIVSFEEKDREETIRYIVTTIQYALPNILDQGSKMR